MLEFEPGNNKEYKVKAIQDSTVYAKKADKYLPGLYYLITWKGYLKEENTWEPFSIVIYLRKMVTIFHKDYPEKPIITSAPLNSALPMTKPTIQLQKSGNEGNQQDVLRNAPSKAIRRI